MAGGRRVDGGAEAQRQLMTHIAAATGTTRRPFFALLTRIVARTIPPVRPSANKNFPPFRLRAVGSIEPFGDDA